MDVSLLIIIILVALIVTVGILFVLLTAGRNTGGMRQQAAVSANLRSLVSAQRQQQGPGASGPKGPKSSLALAAAAESEQTRKTPREGRKLTIEKQLRYAHWPITLVQYRGIQFIVTVFLFIPAYLNFTMAIQGLVLFLSPLMVDAALEYAVMRRYNLFDEDYPVLLLQYVSLLKTGLSTIGGLEAAAKGLDDGSLVRAEVELLIERLKLGLTEEQAINAFGEDVPHPELELFVQSLLLSKRVGGQLSSTLERLAKQVRKRQQFRKQAVAAVGMERSSIWMIALIMSLLLVYLTISSPELVIPAFSHPVGNKIFQGGIALIILGFYWSRRVTNIKI